MFAENTTADKLGAENTPLGVERQPGRAGREACGLAPVELQRDRAALGAGSAPHRSRLQWDPSPGPWASGRLRVRLRLLWTCGRSQVLVLRPLTLHTHWSRRPGLLQCWGPVRALSVCLLCVCTHGSVCLLCVCTCGNRCPERRLQASVQETRTVWEGDTRRPWSPPEGRPPRMPVGGPAYSHTCV